MVVFRHPERSHLDSRAFEFCLCGEVADLVHAGNAEKKKEAQRCCAKPQASSKNPGFRETGPQLMRAASPQARRLCASPFFSAFPA